MKNSLILLFTSILTMWAFGFKTSYPSNSNKIHTTICVDTLKNRIDSLEQCKTKILDKYATEIKGSYETIKDEKEKQEELYLSTDSILTLLNFTDTINKQKLLTKTN